MSTYTPWVWSAPHNLHYSYLLAEDGTIVETYWSGPSGSTTENTPRTNPSVSASNASSATHGPHQPHNYTHTPALVTQAGEDDEPGPVEPDEEPEGEERVDSAHSPRPSYSNYPFPRAGIDVLPPEVQADIGYKDRRFIQTGANYNAAEQLDSRYRRVARDHHQYFFVPGRVFKMLWTEPAGLSNPGKTRNSTHFSTVWCGEQAYSEIRRFIVVRNKGTFSQCIPVQTYNRRGATKQGLVMHDHGVIHTTHAAPNLIPGENLTKYSIRVDPTNGEHLEPESRVNYGKAYAVEHNVKVLNIGMVIEGHRYLIESYFDSAMRGQ